jgi:hypothetical protein
MRVVASSIGLLRLDGGWLVEPLLHPKLVPMLHLKAEEVMDVEQQMVAEAQEVSLTLGGARGPILEHFRTMYGLGTKEASALMTLALHAMTRYTAGTNTDRAWMVAYLQDYLRRSRNSLNMADEMRALKELSRVQGLTRTLPDDAAADFLSIVGKVAAAQDAALPERTITALPAHREPRLVVDEDDDQVFDQENQPKRTNKWL